MKKIFVAGSLNVDLTVCADRFPAAGETVEGREFFRNCGGKGANQAVAAAKLGGNVLMVGCVGKEFGGLLRASLEEAGADSRFVSERGEASGTAVIVVARGENAIVVDPGANALVEDADLEAALGEGTAGDALLCQLEIPAARVEYALRIAKERGMLTFLNPAPAARFKNFSLCDYVIVNESEAAFYTGVSEPKHALMILRKMGAKNVLLTRGSRGSCCLTERGELLSAEAVRVDAVDTTAAGDTFVGGFVVRLLEGAGVEEAMRFASRAAAIAVTRRGAQASIPTRREVECF